MAFMWCKVCNIETNEKVCPVCGMETVEDIPVEIYWCKSCKVPIIKEITQVDKGQCPICGEKTKYLSKDLRPVFPEERLLLELLLDKEPSEFIKSSVWASNNRYYIDGKVYSIPSKTFEEADTDLLIGKLKEYSSENSYEYFEQHIKRFIEANKYRFNYLVNEAGNFIKQVSKNISEEKIVLSFSGGKDSTATADVVIKALGNPSLVHTFGDTTLEFDTTIQYAERYRENHPQAIFQVARNYDQNFMDVCEDIGPPARMMRWCCSMFKTGPITRVLK